MTDEKFEKIVWEAIKDIPKKFLKKLENVEIVIEEEPSFYQLEKLRRRKGNLILGLYEGVPKNKRGNYGMVLPDKITIFKKAVLAIADNNDKVKNIVKNTVWHEIAHHFGFDERQVSDLAVKRKTKRGK